MDRAAWQGHRSVDRWQQLYTDITQGQWGEVLARLERRDLAIEAWRSHVPQLIARGKVAIGGAAPVTATTTAQTLGGCTETISVRPGDVLEVDGVFDIVLSGAGAIGVGTLLYDGAERTSQAIYKGNSGDRATVYQQWVITASAAKADLEFKLQGRYVTTSGVQFQAHTTMRWRLYR